MIFDEDGAMIDNPRYYELEKFLEENENPNYKPKLVKTKSQVDFGARTVSALGVAASGDKSGILIDNITFLQ